MQSWTFRSYLKSQIVMLSFFLLSIILVGIFLSQTIENNNITIFCLILSLALLIVGSIIDYMRKRKFYSLLLNYENGDNLSHDANFVEARLFADTIKSQSDESIKALELLRASQKDYSEYIESWVHEVKTPISAAKLMAENLGDHRIEYELSTIDEYVEQAMFYAKSAHVESDYVLKKYSVDKLVKECIRKNKRYFMLSNIKVGTIDCEQDVLSDEKWMLFILDQIVRNAIKYSHEGDSIDFICVKHSDAVELQIRDYGVGIRVEDLPRIFDKGFTGYNGRSIDTHASGLGLYLAKRFCKELHHELTVSSLPGNTVFSIWFPIEKERLEVVSNKFVR